MMPEPEENRLDQSLRDKFEDFDLPPDARVWAGVEQRLVASPTPALRVRRRPLPLPFLFGLTALLAGMGGWLLPHGAAPERPAVAMRSTILPGKAAPAAGRGHTASSAARGEKATPGASTSSTQIPVSSAEEQNPTGGVSAASNSVLNPSSGTAKLSLAVANPNPGVTTLSRALANPGLLAPGLNSDLAKTDSTAADTNSDSTPATLRALATLERQTLVQLPGMATLAPGTMPADNRTALLTNLRTERAELFRLQRRTDSLLLALGDLPGAPLAAPAVAAISAPADTAKNRPLAHRWSLLLTATPEQNALTLQGPENDSLTALRRNHETGRTGFSTALVAEYRLTPRLSVGGGVGFSTFGTDLRITNKTTDIFVRYDSTTTHTTNTYTSTNQTHSIRIIQVPQLSPVFNGSGQVIRYDTVYVPRQDTVFTTTVQHDTVRTTRKVLTPLISKKETLSTKLLQSNYRFFTVPVLLRYRLTMGPGRWWADVAAGAQLQFFLGGTQVVTTDGENFRTETVTASNGPFRALNVSLSGSLALNYALTNRLSMSVAPSLRWQALSVYKAETGLVQQPTATGLMLGVRFKL